MTLEMKRWAGVTGLLLLLALRWTAGGAEEAGYEPSARAGGWTLGGRVGDDTHEFLADLLASVWTPGDAMLLLNLRGSFLESLEEEANAGLVARRLFAERGLILGLNLFYDTRWTEVNNRFEQVGAGVEVLSRWIDLRANYYHPVTDEKVLADSTTSSTRLCGGRRVTTLTRMRSYEEALEGVDAELGFWLPYFARRAPTALFFGVYAFTAEFEDDVSGVRVRAESRVHPNLTLDAEWYEDEVLNRTDYFVGARIHLPLDFWNGARVERTPERGRVPPFSSRMGDRVYRDFRIRTLRSGPVMVNQLVVVESTSTSSSDPAPEPPPSCYLDSDGEVVCD